MVHASFRMLCFCIIATSLTTAALGQTAAKAVVIGSLENKPNAILFLNPEEKNQGFLLPQLSTTQRLSIPASSPGDDGLMVYDKDQNDVYLWRNNAWTKAKLGDGVTTPQLIENIQLTNNEIRIREGGSTHTQSLNAVDVSGDVSGKINTTSVTKIQGNPINNTKLVAADNGKAMIWNGTQWTAQAINAIDNSITNETITGLQLVSNDLKVTEAGKTLTQNLNTLGLTGDVTGTINTAVVSKIQGNAVNNTRLAAADNGKAMIWNGTQWTAQNVIDNAITNEVITGLQLTANDLIVTEAGKTLTQNLNALNVGGDVTGTINTSVVTKLQGNAVSNVKLAAGDNGKVLAWDGSQWVAQTMATATPMTQYTSIDPSAFSILKERGKVDKSNIAVFEEDDSFVTIYKTDESRVIIAPVSLADGATLQSIKLNYMARQWGNVRFRLLRKTLGGGNEELIDWVSVGLSNTVRTQVFSSFNGKQVIQNNGYTYRIEITLNPPDEADEAAEADHRVYGVQIQFLK